VSAACLLLKVVQSDEERKPLVEPFAWEIEKAPVALLYERGAEAEKDEREARPKEEVAARL
jgi:hypothetical protein